MIDKNLRFEIEQLKSDFISDDLKNLEAVQTRLIEIGGKEVVDFLKSLLAESDSKIRNRAALVLGDIKDNSAVEPLLDAIFKKENHDYNGTLVYALEALDCSQKLKEVFKILFLNLMNQNCMPTIY